MKRLLIACLLGLSLAGVAHAAIDTYEFKDEAERERFRTLTQELRCPKCQNQNIADSNAPIATDLRREIFRMLEEGQSNREIADFLVMRYGDFVLYKPPVDARTYLLWFGPAALLGGGLLLLGVLVVRRRRVENTPSLPRCRLTRASAYARCSSKIPRIKNDRILARRRPAVAGCPGFPADSRAARPQDGLKKIAPPSMSPCIRSVWLSCRVSAPPMC